MMLERARNRTDSMLIAFGLVKLALIFAFFLSFTFIPNAQAQADTSCKGSNLLQELRTNDPEAYKAVIAEEIATPNSQSIFWKLEKAGQQPSWLFGTMHLSDPEIATLPESVKNAIRSSDTLVIEAVDALDPQVMQKTMASLAHLTLLKNGTLRDFVADDLEDELEAAVTQRGIPIQVADRMQPWLIATTVSLPVCEMLRKQKGEKVLDSALADFAKKEGKELLGLETVSEQLTAMASLPIEYHVSALEETLASGSRALDMIETMKIAYKQGRMGVVFPLMKAVMPQSATGEGAAKFQQKLIDDRNQTMLERSLPILENGSAFIAVGALHLPGETGLVKLFRDAGYTVSLHKLK